MSVSRIILGSIVIRSSAGSNRPMSWIRKQNDKSNVRKEVKEKMSSMVVAERGAKGNNISPKIALRTQVIPIPVVSLDGSVLWTNILGLLTIFHKFAHSFHFNHILVQMRFEKAIVDCRFFTLLAVVGSLLGSILCFFEGCFMILKSCLYYVHASSSHRLDSSGVVQIVIEAIDMFLVGSAMLTFGMGLYVMFIRTQSIDTNAQLVHLNSTTSAHNQLQMVPSWLKIHSLSEAKTRIGHAIMIILQVGILDKFKTIPLVTPLDLASFAATLLVSSTSIFLLSKLSSHNYILIPLASTQVAFLFTKGISFTPLV